MVTTSDRTALVQDSLFGDFELPVPATVSPVIQSIVAPIKKTAEPITASSVPSKVAAKFSMDDLFSELKAVATMRNRTFITAFRESTIPQAPELAEFSDLVDSSADEPEDEGLDLGLGTDEELALEFKNWTPSEAWILDAHRQKLDEELIFLTSVDVKPKVWIEKGHTLQWIFTVDQIGDKDVREIPFSFHNCCLAAGYKPDELRTQLLQVPLIRELLVNLRLCRQCDLPRSIQKVQYTDIVGVDSPEIPDHYVYQFSGV